MQIRFFVIGVCALLTPAVFAAELRCRTEPRFSIEAFKERVVVIGEGTHGTNEIPAFVAGVLCNYAMAGRPVVMAWEFSREKQADITIFLNSDGSPAARSALVDNALRGQDGRSSVAILSMLEAVRGLRAAGSRVAVQAVDYGEFDVLLPVYASEDRYALMSQNRRQSLMAINVEELSRHYDDHAVVFFTAHASRNAANMMSGKGVVYESATARLSHRISVASVGFRFEAGSSWRCKGPSIDKIACDAYAMPAGRGYDEAPLDRYVDLGPITASPPASEHPDPMYRPPESRSAGGR